MANAMADGGATHMCSPMLLQQTRCVLHGSQCACQGFCAKPCALRMQLVHGPGSAQ